MKKLKYIILKNKYGGIFMKKVLSLVLVMILMLVALTGCVNIDYTVKVNKDGSGDITYIYGIKKETLESLEMSADDLMSEMKEEVQDSEYIVEAYETDTEIGFKASKHIANVTTDLSLEEAFGEEYITDTEANAIKIEKTSGKTRYSQNAIIDLTDMEDMTYMGITMKYSITLPTKIDTEKTNGTISEDGKTVTWDLELGEATEVKFVATSSSNIWIWIVCGVIGVLVIAGVIIIIIKRKPKNEGINDEQTIEKQVDEGIEDKE